MKKILSLILALVMIATAAISLTSCGNEELNFGKSYSPLSTQVDVLLQLNAKSIDVGVMDSVMANYYINMDARYSENLAIVEDLTLATEQYGVAARKGSGLAKLISKAMIDLTIDGTVGRIAKKYGLESEVCIDTKGATPTLTADEYEDVNYIRSQGKVIIGYTDFAPISYKDVDGNLAGFDVELAKAVMKKLGLEPEFKLINWDSKEAELDGKTIDCIWNGMTITPERQAAMAVSIPYLNNKQVAVVRKGDANKYKTTDAMSNAIIGAESGSAGESCIVKSDD